MSRPLPTSRRPAAPLAIVFVIAASVLVQGARGAITSSTGAAPTPNPTARVLDYGMHTAGNVVCPVTNWGQVGSRPASTSPPAAEPSFEWPAGSGIDYLWAAGLWLGANANGEHHVTTTAFSIEARPGPTPAHRVYETSEGAPGGARHPAPLADDDQDGRSDEDPLNGHDDDLDGQVDEDFAAISDQMLVCEYNDRDPAIVMSNPDHVSLGVDIQQTSLVWSDPRIDDFIALRYRITNAGFNPLSNVYVGLFADCDIGNRIAVAIAEDDRAGFWEGDVQTELGGPLQDVRVSVVYTFDADGDAGQAPGYIGLVFLGARDQNGATPAGVGLTNARVYSGFVSYPLGGDPVDDEQRYEVLNGMSPQSLPPPDPMTGLRPAFVSATNADYRTVLGAGSIPVLEPGDLVEFTFAIVVGPGLDGLKTNAARARLLYDNDWRTMGPVAVTVQDFTGRREDPSGVQLHWRLAGDGDVRRVHVERAAAARGPWQSVAVLTPAGEMSYVDRSTDADFEGTLWYRLVLERADGVREAQAPLHVDVAASTRFALEVPVERADGEVEVRFSLAESGRMDLGVYDVRGRRVGEIVRGRVTSGSHVRVWDGRGISGTRLGRGVYFLRLESAGTTTTRRLLRRK